MEVYEGPTRRSEVQPETFVAYGRYLESSQNLEAAREAYQTALERDRRCAAALLGLARTCSREGDAAGAEEYCRRALVIEGQSPAVLNDLGQCRGIAGNWAGAAEAYAAAVARAPQRELYRNNLAVALFHCGRVEEAHEQFARVSGEAAAHYNLGVLLARQGADVESSRQFVLALLRDPAQADARRWLEYLAARGAVSPDMIPPDPRLTPFHPAPVRQAEGDRGVVPSGHRYVPAPDTSSHDLHAPPQPSRSVAPANHQSIRGGSAAAWHGRERAVCSSAAAGLGWVRSRFASEDADEHQSSCSGGTVVRVSFRDAADAQPGKARISDREELAGDTRRGPVVGWIAHRRDES